MKTDVRSKKYRNASSSVTKLLFACDNLNVNNIYTQSLWLYEKMLKNVSLLSS